MIEIFESMLKGDSVDILNSAEEELMSDSPEAVVQRQIELLKEQRRKNEMREASWTQPTQSESP